MKKADVTVGGYYLARVRGRFMTVRVDGLDETSDWEGRAKTQIRATNMTTGRALTLRSAGRLRKQVTY